MTTGALSNTIFTANSEADAWAGIFKRLADTCLGGAPASELEVEIDRGDRLIADAAWELWLGYADHARSAAKALLDWWSSPHGGSGRAVLVLDALSVREMGIVVAAARTHGADLEDTLVLGAPIPTDTNAFSRALGLPQRSQLKGSGYPKQWELAASGSLYTDSTSSEFGVVASELPPSVNIFIWHSWLDDIVHSSGDKPAAPKHIATTAKTVLDGDGFWQLIEALRQGRELVITSDHGYAISQRFADLPQSLGDEMRKAFGARRCGDVPSASLNFADLRPSVLVRDGRAAVIGPWKWKVQGGFPHVTHGGVSLGEVCVPYLVFPAR